MSLRHHPPAQQPGGARGRPGHQQPSSAVPEPPKQGAYNIILVNDVLADHPARWYPEVRAVCAVLRSVGDLCQPPSSMQWRPHYDVLDWLALFFGFQRDNVRNQREHLVLHLSNQHMCLSDALEVLDPAVLRSFRKKLLKNYADWCSYLGRTSSIWISETRESVNDLRREILYVSLWLLIWGESANLRFMPECICYIFHHMADELNKILEGCLDPDTARPVLPASYGGEYAFLDNIVRPIYQTIRKEVESSKNGTAPHRSWRNYDDINEYFWTERCLERLGWPIKLGSNFFVHERIGNKVGKTGFIEQRSFWNLFHSFNRLWIMLILFLQAAIIIAWERKKSPWEALENRDVQARVLTIFITWSGLQFLQSLLSLGMQHTLITRETKLLGMRMVMKVAVSGVWMVIFGALYGRIWSQKAADGQWSGAASHRKVIFLEAALVFVLPELLGLVLFVVPWIQNFLEESNWKVIQSLAWWSQGRTFVGRGIREGLVDNLKYTLFWLVVLITKFSFSYFLQIKPMIEPTRQLLHLRDVDYWWHQLFSDSNRFAVGLLWAPVVLIYLMDMQIWYSIYSSFVGALVGLLDHLGEIRDIRQLRLRFQFFVMAVHFNLMAEEKPLNMRRSRFHDFVDRLKLRYGLGRPYKKLEPKQAETQKFALLWNEIIKNFREEDILSDHEVELLELLELDPSWEVRVIRWPCFLLGNELQIALSQAKFLVDAPDRWLWYKISKHEYRRCAVIEAYDSIKCLMHQIIRVQTEEHSIVTSLFNMIDRSIDIEKFTKSFKITALPKIHEKLTKLMEQVISPKKDLNKVVNALQALYEAVIRDFLKEDRNSERLKDDGLMPQDSSLRAGLLFQECVVIPDQKDEKFYRQARRLHIILSCQSSMHDVLKSLEAKQRIAFFSNSLFMNMPRSPQVEKMKSFSVLTPYYKEDVLYSEDQINKKNEDGISILYYLKTIYPEEWKNFKQRMRREGMADDSELETTKSRDVRLWVSYRGQTLARTVRGMMYYYRALKMLAFLDSASETDIQRGMEMGPLSQNGSPSLEDVNEANDSNSSLFKGHEDRIASMKFTYVVACQLYGAQKVDKDAAERAKANDILNLLKSYEALRVAYVDEVSRGSGEKEYYSVLVKYDRKLEKEVEIYRVRLPGPLKLGEGKPENQNHAMIFTRGDAVQTIDMNQDNYYEEALKMRNLLEEYDNYYGIRKPTILGVREHIFTGSVSSLAWFMSAQETSFVTLGQRVLANPLKIRMHYGHPDVFDRFWFMSRGGISKASRVINISEDIFAGFNCTLRGGNVTHHEYIQVGKGRDVGLNQISMFEAKVASGNGEQVLSRDVYRLGHRLDFFRMLSLFYTTVGFFFNTMMVILTVYGFLWGRLYLALSGVESTALSSNENGSLDNKALGTILNQQFLIQLGLFTALPMIIENSLEMGFLQAIWDFLSMQLQLSSVFYTFSMGTRAHFFGRTVLHGGAKYRETGRGFVVEHKSFAENYRLYARSHFIKGIELGLILTVYAAYSPIAKSTFTYLAMTISSWFLIVSWIMGPFVFNPSGFDWLKTVNDFENFMNWIWFHGRLFATAEQSWETWWYEEQAHLRTTGLWGKVLEIILDLRFFFFQYAIVYRLKIADGSTSILVYLLSWIYVFLAFGTYKIISYARDKYSAKEHIYYRLVQFLIITLGIITIILLSEFTKFEFSDIFTSLLAFVPTGWGLILIAQVFRPFLQRVMLWDSVVSMARLYDMMLGVIVMAPVAVLSWAPGFQSMQTRILFNEAFTRGLRISQIVQGKKPKQKVKEPNKKVKE
ncbi:callose synthase 12-like [Punica granatum]|uniref:1,3-beta-glucan synthase n=1 Tax=Punica granatum TaxID=22663 RepID=A0A6P8D379_PUNGR|nr:callose synthase 12-like [Punica granatum]